MKKTAAFFDLDNTVIDGSSVYYFLRGLIKHGEVSRRNLVRFGVEHLRYQRKRTENECAITMATKKMLDFVMDKPQKHFVDLCQSIVDEFLPKVLKPEMKAKILEHQEQGHDTWIITASPTELAQIVANDLRMTGAIGTSGEVIDGRYSGKLPNGAMHGIRKAETISALAASAGYDLSRSFAYSDSSNDLPLLISVGNPFIVNPDKNLSAVAAKNNWPILIK